MDGFTQPLKLLKFNPGLDQREFERATLNALNVYHFNYRFDQWVFLPVVNGYTYVTPSFLRNDGSADMLDAAANALREGQTLIIFPEGTRTTPGAAPAFHRGGAAIALRGATIVTPVVIKVCPTTLTKAEPWYRIPKRRFHFSLQIGRASCRERV